ncbi:MAG: DEAD/DEAH box helicase [Promethearchaeota archaeon]
MKKKKNYTIKIQEDLSFLVEFPWYPFTLINAWIPTRRPHYKSERERSINVEELFLHLERETNSVDYDRKFFYDPWVQEQFNIWQRKWKTHNGYWEQNRTHRATKFELQFPQLAQEDLEILRKAGCTISFAEGALEKLKKLEKEANKDFNITIETHTDRLRISWNEEFNKWFHSLFHVFARFMAIRSEDDTQAEYIPCIHQIGPQEIQVDYWAAFRANHFWYEVQQAIKKTNPPLFDLQYQPFQPSSKDYNYAIQPNYTLRSYQQEAMEKWEKNQYYGSIQLPTGAGKSLIGIDAIRQIRERTLILVPNLALVDQWVNFTQKFLSVPVSQIGIFNGQKKAFREYPIVISTYQLLSQYLQDLHAYEENVNSNKPLRDKILVEDTIGFFTHKFGLLIADESHHIQAETFRHIALDLEIPRRLALSATIEKSVHSSLVIATLGPIIHKIGYGLLAREGYIAPIYSKRIHIPLTADEKGYLNRKGKRAYGRVSRQANNKLLAIQKLLEAPVTSQTLIFTSRIKHAMKIHSHLKENGIDTTVLTGHTVMNDRELNQILDQFRQGKIKTLVLVKMLNEGFDAPADTIIIASGTRNRREQIQRVGRATRPGKVAKLFELIIDPLELDYEFEVAQARDISDVIEPHVQDLLLPPEIKEEINKVVDEIKLSFYANS